MWQLLLTCLVLASNALSPSHCLVNPYPKGVEHVYTRNNGGERLLLTPYMKQGKSVEARELSLVTGITPNITSYAGFLTVDEDCGSNLFFWFFPSQNNPETDPVSVWLQGGPGSTSFYGLLTENGPYNLRIDGTLELREYSWNRNSSVIYIDNPVGTGYSYTDNGCYSSTEEAVGRNLLTALEQFFEVFPELKQNPLFLTGESYAGKYIPAAAYAIFNSSSTLNLEGLLIGNGLVDPRNQQRYSSYLYQLGLIDAPTRDSLIILENRTIKAIDNENYAEGFTDITLVLLKEVLNATKFTSLYNFFYSNGEPGPDIDAFVDQDVIRRALHVGDAKWHDGTITYLILSHDFPKSVRPWLEELMENYRVTLYNGQLDIIVAYPLTMGYVQKLQWSGRDKYLAAKRSVWRVNGALAGYSKSSGNFTEVLVRNAGHMVPTDQPEWAFDLFNKFIFNKPLDSEDSSTARD